MHMERTLNPAWFSRRDKKDQYCTLSIMQYWDWVTYIDVRATQSAILVANILICFTGRLLERVRSCENEVAFPSHALGGFRPVLPPFHRRLLA